MKRHAVRHTHGDGMMPITQRVDKHIVASAHKAKGILPCFCRPLTFSQLKVKTWNFGDIILTSLIYFELRFSFHQIISFSIFSRSYAPVWEYMLPYGVRGNQLSPCFAQQSGSGFLKSHRHKLLSHLEKDTLTNLIIY